MLRALSPNIFTRPDGGSARSARPRLMEAIMVDRTAAAAAEIATIRQQLAAAAARIQEKAKSTPTLDLRERMADPPTLDAAARTRRATAQVMHGRAAGSANAAPEWPRLVALLIAGELGFAGVA